MRCVVTGAAGFLGGALARELRSRGWAVCAPVRREAPELDAAGLETVRVDLADSAGLEAVCRGADAVFHVAARAGLAGPRSAFEADNVRATARLLAASAAAGVRRFVHTSTPSVVYGREPIEGGDETISVPERHLCAYAATKAAAEALVLAADSPGLRTCALRPHLIYGAGDRHLLPRLLARARAGRLWRIGDGTNRISVCALRHAVDAHISACAALEAGTARGAYFINDPEPVLCWEFIGHLLAAAGAPPVRRAIPASVAYALGAVCEAAWRFLPGEPPMTRFLALQLSTSHWFRIDKARRELGWSPVLTPAEGIREAFGAPSPVAPQASSGPLPK